jgi:CelD/BcsL family acetyltransferase involved in cellulose biosynthesis
MSVEWEMLDTVDAVEPAVARQWDALAVRLNKPYCAPAWVLAWHHVAPADARMRIVVVRDGDEVVAVAPFCAVPWRLRMWSWSLMGSATSSRIEPVADPSRIDHAGEAIRAAVASADPAPARIRLLGVPSDSPWPMLLAAPADGAPAPWRHEEERVVAPRVALGAGSLDEYLARRSANFRQQMRRARRRFERDGGEFRTATPDELEHAIAEFIALHRARWDHRGGSGAVTRNSDQMLLAAGRGLAPERFQLVSLVVGRKTIGSQLFLAAGEEIAYWNGGFDDAYASYEPSQVALVEAIRISLERGYRRFDLGPGAQRYKYRFTDSEDTLLSITLIPHRGLYVPARVGLAPEQARHAVASRMTREQKARVRRLVSRGRR